MNNVHYHYTQSLPDVNRENQFFEKDEKAGSVRSRPFKKRIWEQEK